VSTLLNEVNFRFLALCRAILGWLAEMTLSRAKTTKYEEYSGIKVFHVSKDRSFSDNTTLLRAKVGAALSLVETHQTRTASRLRRDIRAILIQKFNGRGAVQLIAPGFLAIKPGPVWRLSQEELAAAIVSQGIIARFELAGLRFRYGKRIRHRVMLDTIAFAERLPGGHVVADQWRKMIPTPSPSTPGARQTDA